MIRRVESTRPSHNSTNSTPTAISRKTSEMPGVSCPPIALPNTSDLANKNRTSSDGPRSLRFLSDFTSIEVGEMQSDADEEPKARARARLVSHSAVLTPNSFTESPIVEFRCDREFSELG